MTPIDHCVIIDNNASRISLLEQTIKENKLASTIKLTLNCGHGLVYLKEMWDKVGERKTLVIMNVNTPIMNGSEFLDELKGTPYSKSHEFLLIALNDTMNEKDKEVYQKKGITNFISSPFSLDSIHSLLKEIFNLGEKAEKKEGKPQPSKSSKGSNKAVNNNL
jgi:response regulator RpfG family c-di-GMP phosphodiesterase